jgi:hypothetical protein
MAKSVKITVMTSTNPAVEGRYFATMNDTTGGRNRQMTTVTRDEAELIAWIEQAREQAARFEIELTIEDETKELGI